MLVTAPTTFAEQYSSNIASAIQQELYLDVEVNQSAQIQIGHFLQQDQQLYIDVASLKNFAITTEIEPIIIDQVSYIALDQIEGLSYKYDDLNQKISIQVPITLLSSQHQYGYQHLPAAKVNPLHEKTGVLLNYTAFAQQYENIFSLNGWNEFRVFEIGRAHV